MNREGDADSSDPRTREVSYKPASGGWERNKMTHYAPSVHFSLGAWTSGCCGYLQGFKMQPYKLNTAAVCSPCSCSRVKVGHRAKQISGLAWCKDFYVFVTQCLFATNEQFPPFLLVSQGGSSVFTHQERAQATRVISACLSISSAMVLAQPCNGPPSRGQAV